MSDASLIPSRRAPALPWLAVALAFAVPAAAQGPTPVKQQTPQKQPIRPVVPQATPRPAIKPTPVTRFRSAPTATPIPKPRPTTMPTPGARADQIAASATPLDEAARQMRSAAIAQGLAWSALIRHRPDRGSSLAQIAAALIAAGFDRATAFDAAADYPQPATSATQAAERLRGVAPAEVVAVHLIRRFHLTLDGVLEVIVNTWLARSPSEALPLAIRAARPTPPAAMQTGFSLHRDGHVDGYPGAGTLYSLLINRSPETLAPAATHHDVWAGLSRAGYSGATLFAEVPISDVDGRGRTRDSVSACFQRVRPGSTGGANPSLEIGFSVSDAVTTDAGLRACYLDFVGSLRRNGFDRSAAEALLDVAIRCDPSSHRNCLVERDALRTGLLADAVYTP